MPIGIRPLIELPTRLKEAISNWINQGLRLNVPVTLDGGGELVEVSAAAPLAVDEADKPSDRFPVTSFTYTAASGSVGDVVWTSGDLTPYNYIAIQITAGAASSIDYEISLDGTTFVPATVLNAGGSIFTETIANGWYVVSGVKMIAMKLKAAVDLDFAGKVGLGSV